VSSSSFSLDEDFYGSDTALKHPPRILFLAGLLSVLLGTLVGAYGVINLNTSPALQQTYLGAAGYFLTVILPIVFLQMIRIKHDAALRVNQEEPYDVYAGQQLQSRFLKLVGLGLLCASLSITVFFWPVAQGFA
jgi:uncharacterized membrane protein YiaA